MKNTVKFIILLAHIVFLSHGAAQTTIDRIKESKLELIILPKQHLDPNDINNQIKIQSTRIYADFGRLKNARYLIGNRKKIGVIDVTIGLSPDEVSKNVKKTPDFTLVHPSSIEAKLQRYIVFEYPSKKERDTAKAILKNNPKIMDFSESIIGSFSSTIPNDIYFVNANSQQWGSFELKLHNAWDKATGHAYIGVPDSGLDINNPIFMPAHHPDLLNFRSQFSWNIIGNDPNVDPGDRQSGHGTHVTGIIAASSDNNTGVAGVCWDCSVSFARMSPTFPRIAASYQHFFDIGTQVINSSFGSRHTPYDCSNQTVGAVCDAIQLLTDRDIIIAAAAGNGFDPTVSNQNNAAAATSQGRSDFIQFPASDPRVIAVGATDISGNRAQFSEFGSELDIVAPGTNIMSTFARNIEWTLNWNCADSEGPGPVNDGYGTCTGTSMAAPFITGLLGIMRSVDPLLNSNNVKNALYKSGPFFPVADNEVGHGIPDAESAIDNVLGSVNGQIMENRLTPLFSFYSTSGQDSFYTTVPQMAYPAITGTLRPTPQSGTITYDPAYGASISYYPDFPHESAFSPLPTPAAEIYLFTTKHNPVNSAQSLVPLYRLSYVGANGSNNLNTDHVYTTEQAGITAFENIGYKLDGIEGYIFDDNYSQPSGTEKLYRRYNSARDDHAIFPESKLSHMQAQGYTSSSGNQYIGYVYINQDSDSDGLIDGFEASLSTCLNDADTDNDGISDGDEVLGYPRTDPITVVVGCNSTIGPQYTWHDNALGPVYINRAWEHALGYHFTPQVNGIIDQLGGYFNGTKLVKLFNKSSGALLGQTTVSASNNWAYNTITPVSVQAGVEYTVAVYMAGSGASYRYFGAGYFPKTFDDIQINGTTWISTSSNPAAIPTLTNTEYMHGQADIRFTPSIPPGIATLYSPSGTITDSTPTYTWNAVANSTWYYLWVNDSTGNRIKTWYTAASAGCASGTGTCSVTPATTLATGNATWWIQTWNSYGYGSWSSPMFFNRL